jgi:hypothetical protein
LLRLQEQLDKIAVLDKSIAGLEVKDARNEAQIAVLQNADEKLSTEIEALQVKPLLCLSVCGKGGPS